MAQIQNLFDNLWRQLIGWIFWNWFCVLQASFTKLLIGLSPSVEAGPAHAKISTCLAGISDLLGVLQNS